jgi:hypothetical protein
MVLSVTTVKTSSCTDEMAVTATLESGRVMPDYLAESSFTPRKESRRTVRAFISEARPSAFWVSLQLTVDTKLVRFTIEHKLVTCSHLKVSLRLALGRELSAESLQRKTSICHSCSPCCSSSAHPPARHFRALKKCCCYVFWRFIHALPIYSQTVAGHV